MFRTNAAAFVHDLGAHVLANVEGDRNYVRVQVLKGARVLRGCSPYTRYPPGAVTLRIPGRPRFVQV
jgi:hypothetical protein